MATLRQLAKRRGVTQRALAKRIGVSPAAISQLLDRPNVTLASITAVVGALGYKVSLFAALPDGTRTVIEFPTAPSTLA